MRAFWTSGNDLLLGPFLGVLFLSMIVIGILIDRGALVGFRRLLSEGGQAPSDFVAIAGLGATLVNLGVSGLIATGCVFAIGGGLNGPVIGAILSVVGFAAFGKHPVNFIPVMAGVFLGSLAKPWGAADPSILLAALFGTNLTPIAEHFGWHRGVVAGFIHSSSALSVGAVNGGLNLHNNGFAAAIVAAILAPVILAVRAGRDGGGSRPTSSSSPACRD